MGQEYTLYGEKWKEKHVTRKKIKESVDRERISWNVNRTLKIKL